MRPSIAWLMVLAFHSCLQTGLPMYVGNTRIRRPGRQVFRQFDNHRYHPTTYSKESSEEMDMKDSPSAGQPPFIQYAYQGGQGAQQNNPGESPNYPDDFKIYQGEVLNHVPPASVMKQQSIVPKPHPVYQQMTKKPNVATSPSSLPETVPFPVQGAPFSLHPGVPDGDGYEGHYEHHHEVDDGYHYSPIIHHPLPLPRPTQPPDKSKATISESDYAYYYIGRHLWYVPLYFSIYFIAYVGLLVLKSIARHKVLFPYKSEQTAQQNGRQSDAMYMLDSARRKYAM